MSMCLQVSLKPQDLWLFFDHKSHHFILVTVITVRLSVFFLPLKPMAPLMTSTSRCAGCLLTKTWSSLTALWASTRSTGPESWSSWPTSFTLTWSSVVWSRLRLTESCQSWRWWCPPEGRGTLRVSWLLLSGKISQAVSQHAGCSSRAGGSRVHGIF